MIVISDTSVLFYLSQIGYVSLLPRLFTTVIVPEVVWTELKAASHLDFVSKLLNETWLIKRNTENKQTVDELLTEVDAGEAEAIALSLQLSAHYLLIDEKRGRRVAAKRGIAIVGTLGIFVLAKNIGLVNKIKPLVEQLIAETDFRYSQVVIERVLRDVGE